MWCFFSFSTFWIIFLQCFSAFPFLSPAKPLNVRKENLGFATSRHASFPPILFLCVHVVFFYVCSFWVQLCFFVFSCDLKSTGSSSNYYSHLLLMCVCNHSRFFICNAWWVVFSPPPVLMHFGDGSFGGPFRVVFWLAGFGCIPTFALYSLIYLLTLVSLTNYTMFKLPHVILVALWTPFFFLTPLGRFSRCCEFYFTSAFSPGCCFHPPLSSFFSRVFCFYFTCSHYNLYRAVLSFSGYPLVTSSPNPSILVC